MLGGEEGEEVEEGGDGRSFFYQKWYVCSHTSFIAERISARL